MLYVDMDDGSEDQMRENDENNDVMREEPPPPENKVALLCNTILCHQIQRPIARLAGAQSI